MALVLGCRAACVITLTPYSVVMVAYSSVRRSAGRGTGSGRHVIQWLGGSQGAAAGGSLGVLVPQAGRGAGSGRHVIQYRCTFW